MERRVGAYSLVDAPDSTAGDGREDVEGATVGVEVEVGRVEVADNDVLVDEVLEVGRVEVAGNDVLVDEVVELEVGRVEVVEVVEVVGNGVLVNEVSVNVVDEVSVDVVDDEVDVEVNMEDVGDSTDVVEEGSITTSFSFLGISCQATRVVGRCSHLGNLVLTQNDERKIQFSHLNRFFLSPSAHLLHVSPKGANVGAAPQLKRSAGIWLCSRAPIVQK